MSPAGPQESGRGAASLPWALTSLFKGRSVSSLTADPNQERLNLPPPTPRPGISSCGTASESSSPPPVGEGGPRNRHS